MNTLGMFGWWGLFTWIPAYLDPVAQGGRGLTALSLTSFLVTASLHRKRLAHDNFGLGEEWLRVVFD
jgi:hypothetical protein